MPELSYPVVTRRLLLRPLAAADTDALVSYRGLPEVCRYVPFAPMTADTVRERLAGEWRRTQFDDEGQAVTLGVVERDTGELVGDVILFYTSREHGGGELGYVFHPDAGGRGLATEAAHALLHLAFDQFGLRRVIARLDPRNAASAGVCRKLGMRHEAHLVQNEWFKDGWADEDDYALLAAEWFAAHAGAAADCPLDR